MFSNLCPSVANLALCQPPHCLPSNVRVTNRVKWSTEAKKRPSCCRTFSMSKPLGAPAEHPSQISPPIGAEPQSEV